jgi:hypothetical protein
METQPWLYAGNRLGELWCEMLFSALSAGVIPERRVLDHVARGWIRPSLGYQVEHGIVAPSELPERVVRRDTWSFTPPHRVGIIPGKGARWLAGKVTSCGKPHPSAGAVLMRSVQAVGYQAYKRLRGRRLLAD